MSKNTKFDDAVNLLVAHEMQLVQEAEEVRMKLKTCRAAIETLTGAFDVVLATPIALDDQKPLRTHPRDRKAPHKPIADKVMTILKLARKPLSRQDIRLKLEEAREYRTASEISKCIWQLKKSNRVVAGAEPHSWEVAPHIAAHYNNAQRLSA
jgi:hypothetical protein